MANPSTTEETEGIDVLIAARTAWETLRDELRTHEREDDTFLCLSCYRTA